MGIRYIADEFREVTRSMEPPEVRYARSGNLRIAYSVFGAGPVDLVYGRTAISQLELVWETASSARYFEELAKFARVILWDKRGVGLSDRAVGTPTLEDRMDDVRAVMDSAGSQRAVIFGATDTAAMALLFGATYPERTLGLILIEPTVRGCWSPDFPYAPTRDEVEKSIRLSEEDWGTPAHIDRLIALQAPSRMDDPEFKRWYGRFIRFGSSPSAAAVLARLNLDIDVRATLPAVHVPTLVMKCPGDRTVREESSDYVAAHVAGAKLVAIPGNDHYFWANPEGLRASIGAQRTFIEGLPRTSDDTDRVLKTVVFVDVVDSTRRAASIGDAAWKSLLDRFLSEAQAEVGRFRGVVVKSTGDGLLATFDGPTRGVRCAQALREHARRAGLALRAGVHTGECLVGPGDIAGIAVHIASRICDSAAPGEVATSRTVRDLSVGSDVRFTERPTQTFKGLEGSWETYSITQG